MLNNIKATLADDNHIFLVKAAEIAILTLWGGTAMLDMKGFLETQDFIKQK